MGTCPTFDQVQWPSVAVVPGCPYLAGGYGSLPTPEPYGPEVPQPVYFEDLRQCIAPPCT